MAILDHVKTLLEITDTDKDAMLSALIIQATDEALTYTRRTVFTGLEPVITEMVVYKYNRLGTEGVSSENYASTSFNYSEDYPPQIMRRLKAKRKVGVI